MILSKYKSKYENFNKLLPFLKLQVLLRKIPFNPIQIYRFMILDIDEIPHFHHVRGVKTIRLATREEILNLGEAENKFDTFEARIREGEYCVIAIDKEDIVGYVWFSTNLSYIEEQSKYQVNIPHDAVYTYDAFIKKEYRLRGIWVQFKMFIKELIKEFGRKRIITLCTFYYHIYVGYLLLDG